MAVATKWDNRIYTNIYNALNGKCDIVREANDDEFTKNTVLLEQIHGATAKPDLMFTDCGATITYQVKVFCMTGNRSRTAKELMNTVADTFLNMGFTMIEYNNSGNVSTKPYQIVARFRRGFLGDGEEIPKLG